MSLTKFPRRRQINPAVGNYPPSLVRSWLESDLSIPGRTKADALRDLNGELGTSYQQGRLYEWLLGKREPDRDTRNYMLRCCISSVLYRHGVTPLSLSDGQLDRIAGELS